MQKQIKLLLKTEEFKRFLESASKALAMAQSDYEKTDPLIEEKLIEMGRFYNHFIFTISQDFCDRVKQLKEARDITPEEISRALQIYIEELEEQALEQCGPLFQFFTTYRDKTKQSLLD